MIRTRHIGNGRISQTIDGVRVYRGRNWGTLSSPDCLPPRALEERLKQRRGGRSIAPWEHKP